MDEIQQEAVSETPAEAESQKSPKVQKLAEVKLVSVVKTTKATHRRAGTSSLQASEPKSPHGGFGRK